MKLGALVSGGKDSLFAACKAKEGNELAVLIAIKSKNPESYMFHVPNIDLVKLQAKSMGLPLIFKETKGEKEVELEDLKTAIKEAKEKYQIEGVVSGAIFSKYQKERINKICKELGLESIAPLWKNTPKLLWKKMLDNGFKIIFTAVAANGLGPEWLGRRIDEQALEQLVNLHNTCYVCTGGEGGEFESLVLDCPLFKKKIKILVSEKKWDEATQSGELIIKKAELVEK